MGGNSEATNGVLFGFQYECLYLGWAAENVLEVRLNRPKKRNAMNTRFWKEIGHVFTEVVPTQEDVRVVLLTGAGKVFSAGIDLFQSGNGGGNILGQSKKQRDPATVSAKTLREGGNWQKSWSAINKCNKPVVVAIQNGCFGAAMEMVCFADVRFCNADCVFQAPEVDIGIAADVGGNQMFPKIVGNDSFVREVQLSGRKITAAEALQFGLVSRVLKNEEELYREALAMATMIAEKSPVAVCGIKNMLNFTRDHSVDDSLKFSLTWNAAFVQSQDIATAGKAFVTKEKPKFENAPRLVEKSAKL